MPTTISFVADDAFSKAIDRLISESGLYTSKSEFMRDAARRQLAEMQLLHARFLDARAAREKLIKKAKFNGYPSSEEREKMARKNQ